MDKPTLTEWERTTLRRKHAEHSSKDEEGVERNILCLTCEVPIPCPTRRLIAQVESLETHLTERHTEASGSLAAHVAAEHSSEDKALACCFEAGVRYQQAQVSTLEARLAGIREEGCAAVGALEDILSGVTAAGVPTDPVLGRVADIASGVLATAEHCDHQAHLARVVEAGEAAFKGWARGDDVVTPMHRLRDTLAELPGQGKKARLDKCPKCGRKWLELRVGRDELFCLYAADCGWSEGQEGGQGA